MNTDNARNTAANFGIAGFVIRWLVSLVLVLGTWNPSGHSYVHWVQASVADGTAGPLHLLAGVALLIGWTIFVRTAWTSIGLLGTLLAAAFFVALVWVLVWYRVLAIGSAGALAWVVLVCLATFLAIGMSWGHLQRRASGQVEVEPVER